MRLSGSEILPACDHVTSSHAVNKLHYRDTHEINPPDQHTSLAY